MKKHLIFTKLFDTGGSNSSLRSLVKVLGAENVLLIVEDSNEISFIDDIDPSGRLQTKVFKNLHGYAHLEYRLISNVKEFLKILWSLIRVIFLCARWRTSTITVSSVEPEKFLYFFWLPFLRVNYTLHTVPERKYTAFTSSTCNFRLGNQKKIIVVSHFMKNTIIKAWDIKKQREQSIIVIYNCIDKLPVIKTPYYNKERNRTVVSVGRLDNNKNPDTWLKVAQTITAKHQNISFIWIGNGDGQNTYTNRSKNQEDIKFIGFQAYPENWLKEAFIYYQPSKMESHGIAVVEAMSWGLPCIVSNRGGLSESVTNQYNGFLVEPLDVDSHIIAIEELLQDNGKATEMGDNSKKRFNELYTYPIFKEKIQALYAIN
ncbi:glycosyltransferase [Pedobacter sp. G11]|uniref:glycosyltransferase family 4 protein n=1 Tax=Pedobacter sp. G11 TaxID=2482728 RepID=UPI000F5DA6FA|nr:glycosyltransferase family 4 protein [Pedobacter sp. G11]AZI25852.1 glycosyltransferase [Pedobacter sp. G11]